MEEKFDFKAAGDWEFLIWAARQKWTKYSEEVREKAIPYIKQSVVNITRKLLIVLLASVAIVGLGFLLDSKALLIIGRLGVLGVISCFLGVVYLAVAAFKDIRKGFGLFFRSFVAYSLLITAAIAVLPLKINPNMIITLGSVSFLFAFVNNLAKELIWVRVVAVIMIVGLSASLFFPRYHEKLNSWVVVTNEPGLLKFNHGDVKAGKVRFFSDGKPVVWFYHDMNHGGYVLFDNPGFYDLFPEKLKPINEDVARDIAINESLISSRNFFDGRSGSADSVSAVSSLGSSSGKKHRYAIMPGMKTGPDGANMSQIIALNNKYIIDASNMSYQEASRKADFIIFVENFEKRIIKNEPGKFGEKCYRISMDLNMKNVNTGDTRTVGNIGISLCAFTLEKAERITYIAATKLSGERLRKAVTE